MKFLKITFLSVAAAFLQACASVPNPPLNFTPTTVARAQTRHDAEVKTVSVTVAQAGDRKGKVIFANEYSKIIPDLWKSSLEDALNRKLAFTDSSSKKATLSVKIVEFVFPTHNGGTIPTCTTKVTAIYQITEREGGSVLFEKEVPSKGVVPWNYASAVVTRLTESINRAVQENIQSFLEELDRAKF